MDRLCEIHEIPDGGSRGFDLQGKGKQTMLLVREGDRVHAYKNVCPHHGTRLGWKTDRFLNKLGGQIMCAAHGALFDVSTGRCVVGPCLGQSLSPVQTFVDGAGSIWPEDVA